MVIAGNIYALFIAKTFFAPFEGFLVTLGVLMAAWSGIFLADMALLRRRTGYDGRKLYQAGGLVYGVLTLVTGQRTRTAETGSVPASPAA